MIIARQKIVFFVFFFFFVARRCDNWFGRSRTVCTRNIFNFAAGAKIFISTRKSEMDDGVAASLEKEILSLRRTVVQWKKKYLEKAKEASDLAKKIEVLLRAFSFCILSVLHVYIQRTTMIC